MEREFQEIRWPLARRYGVDNGLNRVVTRSVDDWIGIAACGHTFHEVREALRVLGLVTDDDLRAAGVRLFQLLMPVPLDPAQAREFAEGLDEVLVVEEKNPTLEGLLKSSFYDGAHHPRVVGRRDEHGDLLIAGPRHPRRRRPARTTARPPVGTSRRTAAPARGRDPPAAHPDPAHGEPGAVLLLGLPAQPQHPRRAGHARRWRHRLPRDGGDDGPRTRR